MRTLHIATKTDQDGHLRLDVPLANAVIGVSLTVSVADEADSRSGRYDFKNIAGKLQWKGDAVSAQRRLRDEWS